MKSVIYTAARSLFLISSFISVLFGTPQHARAQAAAYCEGITNTANLVTCLNKYYENKKADMTRAFDALPGDLTVTQINAYKQAHQYWLQYRDAQCAWETALEKTESLKRVKELYCLVRLTEQRGEAMKLALADIDALQIHQGMAPRWENVLNEEFGDIYWKANSHMRGDLNCNGREENIVLGIRKEPGIPGKGQNAQSFVIGLVDNPLTGKPAAQVFTLQPADTSGTAPHCQQNIALSLRQAAAPDGTCLPGALEIHTKSCGNYMIGWDGKTYTMTTMSNDRPAPQSSDEGRSN